MNDPESREPRRPARGRVSADAQTPRRPRAVAGQRAAAKRATQPVQRDEPRPEPVTATAAAELGEAEVPQVPGPLGAPGDAHQGTGASEPAKQRTRRPRAAPRPSGSRSRRAVVTAVLAVAVVAALAVGTVLAVQYRAAIRTDHARTAAMAEAQKAAPVIFSYDYRHLDEDFTKATAFLTGSFRDQYAKTTQTVVKPTALQYHGVVQAAVAKPADGGAAAVSVVSASPDQVVVLAFIDQSTTSTRVTGTQVDQNRVLLTLTHTAQGWLVSGVDAL